MTIFIIKKKSEVMLLESGKHLCSEETRAHVTWINLTLQCDPVCPQLCVDLRAGMMIKEKWKSLSNPEEESIFCLSGWRKAVWM